MVSFNFMLNMENQVCLFLREYQPGRESCRSACGFLKTFCVAVKHDGQGRVAVSTKAQMMREFTKLNLHSASLFSLFENKFFLKSHITSQFRLIKLNTLLGKVNKLRVVKKKEKPKKSTQSAVCPLDEQNKLSISDRGLWLMVKLSFTCQCTCWETVKSSDLHMYSNW